MTPSEHSRYTLVNALEIEPDWKQLWAPAEAEKQLEGFKFAGVGWYLYVSGSMLVLPGIEAAKFWFWVYDQRSPCEEFNRIVNAPVRVDERGVSTIKQTGMSLGVMPPGSSGKLAHRKELIASFYQALPGNEDATETEVTSVVEDFFAGRGLR